MSKGKKKRAPPSRQPVSMADVNRAKEQATSDGCRLALTMFFTVLLDKEGMSADDLQRIWAEIESLSDSVAKGYVNVSDLAHVLKEEYEIGIWDGSRFMS